MIPYEDLLAKQLESLGFSNVDVMLKSPHQDGSLLLLTAFEPLSFDPFPDSFSLGFHIAVETYQRHPERLPDIAAIRTTIYQGEPTEKSLVYLNPDFFTKPFPNKETMTLKTTNNFADDLRRTCELIDRIKQRSRLGPMDKLQQFFKKRR